MKLLKTVLVVVFIFLIGAFVGGKYLADRQNSSPKESLFSSEKLTKDISVSELMKRLDIYEVKQNIKAPDFTLTSLNGRKVSLKEHRGRLVLLAFWTTW